MCVRARRPRYQSGGGKDAYLFHRLRQLEAYKNRGIFGVIRRGYKRARMAYQLWKEGPVDHNQMFARASGLAFSLLPTEEVAAFERAWPCREGDGDAYAAERDDDDAAAAAAEGGAAGLGLFDESADEVTRLGRLVLRTASRRACDEQRESCFHEPREEEQL